MKKSEMFDVAISCVIDDKDYPIEVKIEVLEMLFEKRGTELWSENNEDLLLKLKGGENA